MFLPNLDGDFVDVSGRRKNRSGGSGRGRRNSAGLLTLGWWCRGCTARALCLVSFFRRHFLKEGVWSWFWIQYSYFHSNRESTATAVTPIKSRRKHHPTFHLLHNISWPPPFPPQHPPRLNTTTADLSADKPPQRQRFKPTIQPLLP